MPIVDNPGAKGLYQGLLANALASYQMARHPVDTGNALYQTGQNALADPRTFAVQWAQNELARLKGAATGGPNALGEYVGSTVLGKYVDPMALARTLTTAGKLPTVARMADELTPGDLERLNRVKFAEDEMRLPNLAAAMPPEMLPAPVRAGAKEVWVYRGVPTDAPDVIRPGDWVSLDPKYASQHGGGDVKHKVVKMKVPADHVSWAGSDQNEFWFTPR